MDDKKPPAPSATAPVTKTMRTERPSFLSAGDPSAADGAPEKKEGFDDDDTFLDGRSALRRPATAELSVLEVADEQHQATQTGSHTSAPEALAAFGEGAVLEDTVGHTTEVLEAPPSREEASSVDVERWSAGADGPRSRPGGAAEALPAWNAADARLRADHAIAEARIALGTLERSGRADTRAAATQLKAALELLVDARARIPD